MRSDIRFRRVLYVEQSTRVRSSAISCSRVQSATGLPRRTTRPSSGAPSKEARGEFDSECPGYCGAQETFYVGTLKGVGGVYQQTVIDTYAKVAFAKLDDRKTPITAAEILNDRFYLQED